MFSFFCVASVLYWESDFHKSQSLTSLIRHHNQGTSVWCKGMHNIALQLTEAHFYCKLDTPGMSEKMELKVCKVVTKWHALLNIHTSNAKTAWSCRLPVVQLNAHCHEDMEVLIVLTEIWSSDVICTPLSTLLHLCFTVDGIINVLYSTAAECGGVYVTLHKKQGCNSQISLVLSNSINATIIVKFILLSKTTATIVKVHWALPQ